MSQIPKHLQAILWSTNIAKLDLEKDAPYIIHQVLSYGRLDQIVWIFKNYSRSKIIEIFLNHPYKDYFASRFNFVKNYLLNLKNLSLDEKQYVKNIPRYLG